MLREVWEVLEMPVINFFVSAFLALVPEMEHVFFNKILPMTLIAML
jgi:hypothetical protein